MNLDNVSTSVRSKQTNIKKKTGSLKADFEAEVKTEIGKLEGKMKIGWSTMKKIAEKVRTRNYSDASELKNLKFTKENFHQITVFISWH